jgi:hypothetical protein
MERDGTRAVQVLYVKFSFLVDYTVGGYAGIKAQSSDFAGAGNDRLPTYTALRMVFSVLSWTRYESRDGKWFGPDKMSSMSVPK